MASSAVVCLVADEMATLQVDNDGIRLSDETSEVSC